MHNQMAREQADGSGPASLHTAGASGPAAIHPGHGSPLAPASEALELGGWLCLSAGKPMAFTFAAVML